MNLEFWVLCKKCHCRFLISCRSWKSMNKKKSTCQNLNAETAWEKKEFSVSLNNMSEKKNHWWGLYLRKDIPGLFSDNLSLMLSKLHIWQNYLKTTYSLCLKSITDSVSLNFVKQIHTGFSHERHKIISKLTSPSSKLN